MKKKHLNMMHYMKCICCNALQIINAVMAMVLTAAACRCLLAAPSAGGALLIGKPSDLDRHSFDVLLLAKLASSTPNQKAWLQLVDANWHDSAIDRFFVVGPMDSARFEVRMSKEQYIDDRSKVRNVKLLHGPNVSISDIIQKIQQVATTEYKISKSVPGTGVINASLWTLLFLCPSEPLTGCSDGSIVPIVLTPSPPPQSTTGAYYYATVWLQFPAGDHLQMSINAIPASIKTTPATLTSMGSRLAGESSLSSVYNIHHVPFCASTKIWPPGHFRKVLDSAYGLAPSIICAEFQVDEDEEDNPSSPHLKVLLVGGPPKSSQYNLFTFPFLGPLFYDSLPMDQCSGAAVIQRGAIGLDDTVLLSMYHHNSCIVLLSKEPEQQLINNTDSRAAVDNYTLVQVVKSTLDVLYTTLSQCSSADMQVYDACKLRAPGNQLSFLERFFRITLETAYSDYDYYTLAAYASIWVRRRGNFSASRLQSLDRAQLIPSEKLRACSKPGAIYFSRQEYSNGTNGDSLGDVAEAFATQASEYLTSYITEHNTAFTTSKGPATDPYTFYALLITTSLSVITIAVPFTNFILRAICHLRPFYLKSRSKQYIGAAGSRAFKVTMHVCGNVVLSLVFLLPVLSLAKNELERQDAFSTWDIRSSDLELMDVRPIRVIYLFSVTSKYKSQFLNIIVLVICLTIVPVALLTARRCFQVFARYGLLLEESLVMANESPAAAPLTSSAALLRAFKAIEMGEAEYLHLHHRVTGDLELICHGQLFQRKLPAAGLKQNVSRDAESSSLHFISRSSKY